MAYMTYDTVAIAWVGLLEERSTRFIITLLIPKRKYV